MQKYVFGWGFRHAAKEYLHNGASLRQEVTKDKLKINWKGKKEREDLVFVFRL